MNKELNIIKKTPPYKEMSFKESKNVCDKMFDEEFRKRENSLVMDTFYGQLINIFKCKCGLETYSFEKILDMPLLLPKDNNTTIEKLLDEYFIEEEIHFETPCESCKKKTLHTKKVKISQPPNVLILSIQRKNERTGRKNNCNISFPDELDISNYIDHDIYKNNRRYSLYGIGNHSGSLNFGHYYAYIKLNNGEWCEYNDSLVTSHPISSRCSSSEAYILFYKKNN
jgi:ubiquitin C-terminal hydrolase